MFYESFWIESRWYLCISICIFLHTYIAICVCIYMNIYVKTLGGEGCLQDSGVPGSTLASASWSNSPIMLYSPWCQCTQTCSHVSFIKKKQYLYASARCKQPSGESFLPGIDSLLYPMCDTARLVPNRFLTDGSWPRRWDAGFNSGRRGVSLRFWGPRFNTGIHLMKQLARNWCLHCCQCMEICTHVSIIQNNASIYIFLWFS